MLLVAAKSVVRLGDYEEHASQILSFCFFTTRVDKDRLPPPIWAPASKLQPPTPPDTVCCRLFIWEPCNYLWLARLWPQITGNRCNVGCAAWPWPRAELGASVPWAGVRGHGGSVHGAARQPSAAAPRQGWWRAAQHKKPATLGTEWLCVVQITQRIVESSGMLSNLDELFWFSACVCVFF